MNMACSVRRGRGGSLTETDETLGSVGNQSKIHGTHKHALNVCLCPQKMCWLTWVCHKIIGREDTRCVTYRCAIATFLGCCPLGCPIVSGQPPSPDHVDITHMAHAHVFLLVPWPHLLPSREQQTRSPQTHTSLPAFQQ